MSAAKRTYTKNATTTRTAKREIDVFLIPGMENRMAAIKAVASGALPIEAVSINLWKIKEWALDVNQPAGQVHGFKITERGKGNGEEKREEGGNGGRNGNG